MSTITALPLEVSRASDLRQDALPHVLLVVDSLIGVSGGGERMVFKLASLLPQYGFRVSILCFAVAPEGIGFTTSPCPIYVLPLKRTYDFRAISAAFAFRRFIKDQNIQIVQTFFESSDLWAGFVTKAMSNAKLIWSRRDMGILRTGKHKIAYRLLARFPDAVFAVSESVRQHCIIVDRIDPASVQTIHNALELKDWKTDVPVAKPFGTRIVTSVGNIRYVKGHDVLIRAAGLVVQQFPKVIFNIAGEVLETAYFLELGAMVQDLNLSNNFYFVGNITDLRAHLAGADIFVLPSRSEGFSNAIVEAMAASLPVVATNVGGNAEAVRNGISGFIVPVEDPRALADAIIQLLHDPLKSKEMGAAGKKIVAEDFTTEAMMEKTVSTYRGLLS
jgi:glycosyltransferase involved in cell wall biosynthesis